MKKGVDAEFYEKADLGDEMRASLDSGRGFVGENMTPEAFLSMVRERRAAEKARNASQIVTMRMPSSLVERYRRSAAAAGLPDPHEGNPGSRSGVGRPPSIIAAPLYWRGFLHVLCEIAIFLFTSTKFTIFYIRKKRTKRKKL